MKDITLKIATKLGISITTVSKALKNYPDVSDKTKKAVVELAQQLHYTPNSFAVNLRTKESKNRFDHTRSNASFLFKYNKCYY
jgi:LacI family transcriptional regulator